MKKTLASLALILALLIAFLPSALASSWSGDPTQIDEEPYDILVDEDAPDDIYGDWGHSPKTGDMSSILMYASMASSALAASAVLRKRAK
ncbi:MAG: LPXTG cell wall anchor domain-containing protein [Eubacteriaceae bacterium]|nr:LPXTG cell wall anchor domain-containing protein [Eubacteriaceae bacterium]